MGGRKPLQIEGARFGRLTAVRRSPRRRFWLCQCDCGQTVEVFSSSLIQGVTRSCGCLAREIWLSARTKHGRHGTKEWKAWIGMRYRCSDPKYILWKDYGGRGIRVCERWKNSFEAFFQDMGAAPSPEHSLDRIDSDGDYSPENCRWATLAQQAGNKRTVRLYEHEGRRLHLADWSRVTGINYGTLMDRIRSGWSIEKALTVPVRGKAAAD
jgi:hypothetical protein